MPYSIKSGVWTSPSPSLTVSYDPACEGQTVQLYPFRITGATGEYYSTSPVQLVDNTVFSPPGGPTALTTTNVLATNLPAGADSGRLYAAADDGERTIVGEGAATAVVNQAVALAADVAPVPLRTAQVAALSGFGSRSVATTPMAGGSSGFDAAGMLPIVSGLQTVNDRATWTIGADAATRPTPDLVVFESAVGAAGTFTRWTWYVPAGTTSAAYPPLTGPASAAIPSGGTLFGATVALLRPASLATVDASWREWTDTSRRALPDGAVISVLELMTAVQ